MSNKCHFCKKLVEDDEAKICGSVECYEKSCAVNMGDDYLSTKFNEQENVSKFLLETAYNAVTSPKCADIYTPYPNTSKKVEKDNSKIVKKLIVKKLQEYFAANTINDLFDILGSLEDEEIIEMVGKEVYAFAKYTLMVNKFLMKPVQMFKANKLQTFEVFHDKGEFDERVKVEGHSFLYHGSGLQNWYSIMMNGLKVFSGTKMMANGAAYGKGIYLSDMCHFSSGYSAGAGIVGVFEVIGNKGNYKKTNAIYVVPDEQLCRLKYILSGNIGYDVMRVVDDKFNRKIHEELKVEKTFCTAMSNKRLLTELKKVKKIDGDDLEFDVDDMNIMKWLVKIKNIDPESPLHKDLQKIGMNGIEMELTFPDNYPMLPPFVRVLRPRFQFRSGHITSGGSLCLKLLSASNWSPAYSIENLMIHIKSLVLEGEGRVDMKNWSKTYGLSEAREAYNRMLRSHGWD